MTQCAATSKRTGQQCGQQAMHGRRVCYHHGGATPRGAASASFRHGRYSKDLPPRLLETYREAVSDPALLSLSPDLALVDAVVSDLIKRLDTGESGQVWRQLAAAKRAYQAAMTAHDLDAARTQLEEMVRLIDRGHSDLAVLDEIGDQLDRRGRLVATETRRIQLARGTMTAAEAMVLVSALVSAIRREVSDTDALGRIEVEFARILGMADSAAVTAGADAESD